MGEKGARMSEDASAKATELVEALSPLGNLRSKAMFGGFGVFCDDVMFAIVDARGRQFLRVGPANEAAFEAAGAERHGRMPYGAIPPAVLENEPDLLVWSREAFEVALSAKK